MGIVAGLNDKDAAKAALWYAIMTLAEHKGFFAVPMSGVEVMHPRPVYIDRALELKTNEVLKELDKLGFTITRKLPVCSTEGS